MSTIGNLNTALILYTPPVSTDEFMAAQAQKYKTKSLDLFKQIIVTNSGTETKVQAEHKSAAEEPQWVDSMRFDHLAFQAAARALWPKDCTYLRPEQFAEIVMNIPSAFVEKFGSDYQKGITKEHLIKYFWLVIPREGDAAKMSEESFTRALAALYRPTPEKIEIDQASMPQQYHKHYRYMTRSGTLVNRDPGLASVAIEHMYNALYNNKNVQYYGDLSRAESTKILQEMAREMRPPGYILQLAESQRAGKYAWGINLKLSLMLPVRFEPTDEFLTQHIPLLLRCGEQDAFFWTGHRRYNPSKTLDGWLPMQIKEYRNQMLYHQSFAQILPNLPINVLNIISGYSYFA
jgi:hypothetical protein